MTQKYCKSTLMYYITIILENNFFFFAKIAAWQAMYLSAAKIDGGTMGTVTRARFKLEQCNKKISFFSSKTSEILGCF